MATYYIGAMAVGDNALMHIGRPEGSLNRRHKYVKKEETPNGTRYYYPEDLSPKRTRLSPRVNRIAPAARGRATLASSRASTSNASKFNSASAALRKQYQNETRLSDRTRGNTSSVSKNAYAKTYGGPASAVGRTMLKNDSVVRSVISQARSIKDWSVRSLDWASKMVRDGVAAARTFISNLLKKLGGAASTARNTARNLATGTKAFVNSQKYKTKPGYKSSYKTGGERYMEYVDSNGNLRRRKGVPKGKTVRKGGNTFSY